MSQEPPPTIAAFDFGTDEAPDVPDDKPSATLPIRHTVWHIAKLLDAIVANKQHPIHYRSGLCAETFAAFPGLKVVRAFQPMQRVSRRKCQTVTIETPEHPRQQQAMLLHVLEPGPVLDPGRRATTCTACRKHDASGPFRQCVSGGLGAKFACTNCYWSGTGHTCSLRLEHEQRQQYAAAVAAGRVPVFPQGSEKKASSGELELWLQQVEGALRMRGEAALLEERQRLAVPSPRAEEALWGERSLPRRPRSAARRSPRSPARRSPRSPTRSSLRTSSRMDLVDDEDTRVE